MKLVRSLIYNLLFLATAGLGFAQIAAEFIPVDHYLEAFAGGSYGPSGQTFTSSLTGNLGKISVLAEAPDVATGPISVEFRNASGGVPTTLLGTVLVSGLNAGFTPTSVDIDFSSLHIPLVAGTQYGFDLVSTNLFGLEGAYDAYAGGQEVVASGAKFVPFKPSRDLYFSVELAGSPVPEPSTYGLLAGLSLAALALFRSRARHYK